MNQRTGVYALILIVIVIIMACNGGNAPRYQSLGTVNRGGASLNYIVVDVDNLDKVKLSDMIALVKQLIGSSNAQKMYEANTAYYFFDKSQDVTFNTAASEKAKAYYWYLTKLLITGDGSMDKRAEVLWK